MSKRSKTSDKVDELVSHLRPVAEQIASQAQDFAGQAQELAAAGKEWAAPYAAQAQGLARQAASEAADFASDAKQRAVSDYLPKAKAAAQAAKDKVAEAAEGLASETSSHEGVKMKNKKKCCGKVTTFLALLGSAGGAGYFFWKRSQPVDDPWAETYWESDGEDSAAGKHKA